ncbi:MAG: amidohydrolase [Bacteroidota bacterium]|jgi:predicted amidohydrolase
MRISIVQSGLVWENIDANLRQFSEKLAPLAGMTDLVVLPEMFTTGFTMNAAALAEDMNGRTLNWLKETAGHLGAAVAGSFICSENGSNRNRLVFMFPDGHFEYYDKRHLFTLAGEHEVFSPGNRKMTVEWMGFRICPMICYDLRFPVWSRNQAGTEAYDLLLYVANWPSRRGQHWRSLLPARAIENQSYVVGVNVVGRDGNDLEYSGDSCVIDYSGQQLVSLTASGAVVTVSVSLPELHDFRARLPFLNDADQFLIK